ncbi:hypothetical protein MASR2M70_05660 [Bacillota bacterium]
MNRKKILAAILTITMCLTMIPVGVFGEDPPSGERVVNNQEEFNSALADVSVTHIIAESANYSFEPGFRVISKNITIDSTASLVIGDGCRVVLASGYTFTLSGKATIKQNGELWIGGTLTNNAELLVGGIMKVIAPARVEIGDSGTVVVSDDPERGFGHISVFDIISKAETDPYYTVSSVTLTGKNPELSSEAISWSADVNGPKSLDYAMGMDKYQDIILSGLQDTFDSGTNQQVGVTATYGDNLNITKPLIIEENDTLTVNGNVTVTSPGELIIDGTLKVNGNLINNNSMYISGTLTVGGTATNNGYYIQTAEATVNKTISDAGEGNHMKGYYVTNQGGWDAAIDDSTHCNPIIVAPEASITVSTDTTITSNLIVRGNLTIDTDISFTLKMRYDGDTNGVMNNLSGTLINKGTLNLKMPLDICGTLKNIGIIKMDGYDGNDKGENWTTDGHIFLYTELNGEGSDDDKSGFLNNYGYIFNSNTISINHAARMANVNTGTIDNYGRIETWDGISDSNIFPLSNNGLIWGGEIKLNYEGLFYSWTDGRNLSDVGRYPVPAKDDEGNLFRVATASPATGEETYVLFYHYYDNEDKVWVCEPIDASDKRLSIQGVNGSSPDDHVTFEKWADMSPEDIASIVDPDFTNFKFIKFNFSKFDDYVMSFDVDMPEDPMTYYLPISVQLPELGYYRENSTKQADMEQNYIKTFGDLSYVPNSDPSRTFYMIADIDAKILDSNPSFEYVITEGGGNVVVEPTYDNSGPEPVGNKKVYKITVKDDVYGGFPLNIRLTAKNGASLAWESERFIWIDEAETEGLVFAWPSPQWGKYEQGGVRFDYPVLQGDINYEARAILSLGNPTLALFHKYMEGEVWVYDPVSASDVTITGGVSGMVVNDWAEANGVAEVNIGDVEYDPYKFTQIPCYKLGDYVISYTVGEGGGAKTFTLPLKVILPDVGFYSDLSMDSQDMEDNFIEEFKYIPGEMTFYAILLAPEGFAIDSISCTDDNVIVEQVDDSPVYSITVKENANAEFNLKFMAEFINNSNHGDKRSSEMWINIHEGEAEGLAYRNLDWDGEAGGHFENMDWGLETRLNADPREHVGIFYKKESDGAGGWNYTPVDVKFNDDNMTISALEPDRIYSGGDENKNVENAEYYRSIKLKTLGSFTIEYTELSGEPGEKTFTLPVNVDFPSLGAYSSTDKTMDNWLSEVDFTQYREVLLIPHNVDMTGADLAKSEFKIDDTALNYSDGMYTGAAPGGASVTITPYKEGDLIKHFTLTVSSAPFGPDFRLFARIKDGSGNEMAYSDINFFGRINKAGSVVNGGIITITEGPPGTVTFNDLGKNAVKYYAFTAADLTGGKAYAFSLEGYTAGGGDKSDGAMLYLFDENWKLLDESSWENLSDEGRVAAIGSSELVQGKTYYIAVYNGHSSEAACGFKLTGAIVDIPATPVITPGKDEGIGVSGVMVSGAVAGQKYEIYSLVGDQWHHRGSRDFDINMGGEEYAFFNAFDLVMDSETVTQFAAAISKNGVEGSWAFLTSPVPIARADSGSHQPLNVQVLHYPESSDLMVTAINGLFEKGVYYRLRHEKLDGFWDFHGSFMGNGTDTVLCGCDGELADANADGRCIVAAYSESNDAGTGTLRLGWTYAVNVVKDGQATSGIGAFAYERPTKWLAVGEEDFNQNNRGQRILSHSISDGRTKFRLVTYKKDAVGDKYTFSQPLKVSGGLTASAGLTLSDMTGDETEFVKFSFAEMGEYIVSYTDGAVSYKVILSANSPAAPDVFDYTFDRANGKADITINIQSLKGREGQTVQAFYALYEGGRMVGLETRNPLLGLNGFSDNVTVNFNPAANPDNCKAFVLSGGSYVPVMNTIVHIVPIVPAPLLTKIETSMDGEKIWLSFDKAMADPAGKHGQFTLYVNGAVWGITSSSLKAGDNRTIELNLASSLEGSEIIKIAYTPGDIAAADGALLGAIIPEGLIAMQEGEPAFTAGVVSGKAHVGTELTVGPGTLTVQTNLTYIWFRSDDQNFDPLSDSQLGVMGTKYTPVAADKGKYIIVHASTPDAAGDKYAVIQVAE